MPASTVAVPRKSTQAQSGTVEVERLEERVPEEEQPVVEVEPPPPVVV